MQERKIFTTVKKFYIPPGQCFAIEVNFYFALFYNVFIETIHEQH